jgi:hypothetical protein
MDDDTNAAEEKEWILVVNSNNSKSVARVPVVAVLKENMITFLLFRSDAGSFVIVSSTSIDPIRDDGQDGFTRKKRFSFASDVFQTFKF